MCGIKDRVDSLDLALCYLQISTRQIFYSSNLTSLQLLAVAQSLLGIADQDLSGLVRNMKLLAESRFRNGSGRQNDIFSALIQE